MRQRIKNVLSLECTDVDFTTSSNIEVYIRQNDLFLQYTPSVISEHQLAVEVPFTDAMRFKPGECFIQFAMKDAFGNSVACDSAKIPVRDLLKEAGYDPT